MVSRQKKSTERDGRRRRVVWLALLLVVAAITIAVVLAIAGNSEEGATGEEIAGEETTGGETTGQGSTVEAAPVEELGGAEDPDINPDAVAESVLHSADQGEFDGETFLATFDGEPSQPEPFRPIDWDVTVHSRDPETWQALNPIAADHGPDCSAPPDTHIVTDYEDAAYLCRNHMMTSIRGDAYGLVYLTPPYQVDFSDGTAVISIDVSTRRTSVRDWWDIWISPYDDALQLPLDLDASADLSGPPKNAIRIGLGTENQMTAEIYEDFANVQFPDWPNDSVSGDNWTGYETFLETDLKRRDTFEVHISQTRLRVGMPDYDFWWIDTEIPALDWNAGVVQFGHHSYNPVKTCNSANNPKPPVQECLPNTWHWDNASISPALPFTIVPAEQRTANASAGTMTFAGPAPANAKLRFAGIGLDMMVRFDDGSWQSATVQDTKDSTAEEHFSSYWVDVPAGTTKVAFAADDWYGGAWHVRDASFWSPESPES